MLDFLLCEYILQGFGRVTCERRTRASREREARLFFYPAGIQILSCPPLGGYFAADPRDLGWGSSCCCFGEGFEPKAVCLPHIWIFWGPQLLPSLSSSSKELSELLEGFKGDTKSTFCPYLELFGAQGFVLMLRMD